MPHSLTLYTKTPEAGLHAYEDLTDIFPKQILSDKKKPELIGDSRKDTFWGEYKYQKTLMLSRLGVKSFDEAENKVAEMAAYLRTFGEVLVRTDGLQGCVGHRDSYAATLIIG